MNCEHDWHFVRTWEVLEKVGDEKTPFIKSKWICSKCGFFKIKTVSETDVINE